MPPSPSPFHLLLLRLFISAVVAAAQPSTAISTPTADGTFSFRPGIAVVVGIFAVMFSLTFLLLVYAKFCRSAAAELFGAESPADAGGLLHLPSGHLLAGLDKAAIESLPFFRFAALRGARGGLECAVCLAPFADADVLRLLPKCKHAFHVPCVDRWLESRATCPLCRQLVDADDAALFKNSTSARFMFGSGRLDDDIELELFVEREGEGGGGDCNGTRGSSSRFSIGSSFWKAGKNSREESANGGQGQLLLHKFKHRIIVSDVVFKRRWSDLNSSDLLSLSADMLYVVSSKRFTEVDSIAIGGDQSLEDKKVANDDRILKIKEEMEKKRVLENKARQIHQSKSEVISSSCSCSGTNIPRALISPGERSMSEITNLSRFRPVRDGGNGANDEKLRRIWLPIARRTVQWFAGRERRSSQNQIRGTEEPTWV